MMCGPQLVPGFGECQTSESEARARFMSSWSGSLCLRKVGGAAQRLNCGTGGCFSLDSS
jgi:hypothetical protein